MIDFERFFLIKYGSYPFVLYYASLLYYHELLHWNNFKMMTFSCYYTRYPSVHSRYKVIIERQKIILTIFNQKHSKQTAHNFLFCIMR